MKVQFIVSVATVLLSAVPSAFAAEPPVLRGAILATDSFLDNKSAPKSTKSKDDKDPKSSKEKDDKDSKNRSKDNEKGGKGNRCFRLRSYGECVDEKGCAVFGHKDQLYCAPKDYNSKKGRSSLRHYFKSKKKSSEVSFVDYTKNIRKGGVKGLDKRTLRRLCNGDLKIKGMKDKELKDLRRALGCKKMESEDYYDFEVESPYYDSGDSFYSEDFEDFDFDSEDFDFEDFDSEDFE